MNPDSEETPKSKPECPSDQLLYTIGHGGIARPSGHTILIILKPEKKVQEHIWSKNKFYDQNKISLKKNCGSNKNLCPKEILGSKRCFGSKKLCVQKNSCLEKIMDPKSFGPKKFGVRKKCWALSL